MKFTASITVLAILAVMFTATTITNAQDKDKKMDLDKVTNAVIHTTLGDIEIEFYPKDAPRTVRNWVQHAQEGYYDGVIFHRVIKGFMMQGGDPTGTGRGGESIYGAKFDDEINKNSELYKRGYKKGVLAMANAGPNTNGSQFFIMHADYPLPPSYTIFANVVKGIEIVDAICNSKTGAGDKPVEKIEMKSITLKMGE